MEHERQELGSPPMWVQAADADARAAHLAWVAGALFRKGKTEAALSRIAEARAIVRDPAVKASLERLERQAHLVLARAV